MRVGQHPQTGAVPAQDLDPGMAAIGEDKERTLPGILSQTFCDHGMETIEAFAHITRLHRHEHFQTAGKTQHDNDGWPAKAPNKTAASLAWSAPLISMRA